MYKLHLLSVFILSINMVCRIHKKLQLKKILSCPMRLPLKVLVRTAFGRTLRSLNIKNYQMRCKSNYLKS